jgi:hypothetical protein
MMFGWYGRHAVLITDEPATPAHAHPDGAINLTFGAWLSQGFTVATRRSCLQDGRCT